MHSLPQQNKILFLVILGLILTGCASQFNWVNPSNPKADFAVAQYECTNLANQSINIFDSSSYAPPPAINEGPRANSSCNNPGASPVNCFSSTPQSAIPLTDSQLLGQTNYERFVTQCLERRGWQKVKVQ
jgi:hypothetical protein